MSEHDASYPSVAVSGSWLVASPERGLVFDLKDFDETLPWRFQ